MAFSTGGGGGGAMADINVTPLVDVMLVLLILFMISAPLVMQRLDLPLPLPQATPQPPIVTNKLKLQMNAAGAMWMDGREISRSALSGVLALEAGRGDHAPSLSIDANPDAPYQAVAEVLSLAQNAGIDKLELLGR